MYSKRVNYFFHIFLEVSMKMSVHPFTAHCLNFPATSPPWDARDRSAPEIVAALAVWNLPLAETLAGRDLPLAESPARREQSETLFPHL
jgi:hypothetical protein